jgi:hypothetical protein
LEQAGAYIRETRLSLADYLQRLRGFPALTVAKGRPRDRDPSDTVATTWQVSLQRVRSTAGAAVLLEVCAFLGPEEMELFARQLEPPAAELHLLARSVRAGCGGRRPAPPGANQGRRADADRAGCRGRSSAGLDPLAEPPGQDGGAPAGAGAAVWGQRHPGCGRCAPGCCRMRWPYQHAEQLG